MNQSTLVCATCGTELLPDARFCATCGAPIPVPDPVPTPEPAPQAVCPACGTCLPENACFCITCGAPVAAPTPEPTPEEPAPQPVCATCGADLLPDARFCPVCGTPVAVPAAAPAPEAPAYLPPQPEAAVPTAPAYTQAPTAEAFAPPPAPVAPLTARIKSNGILPLLGWIFLGLLSGLFVGCFINLADISQAIEDSPLFFTAVLCLPLALLTGPALWRHKCLARFIPLLFYIVGCTSLIFVLSAAEVESVVIPFNRYETYLVDIAFIDPWFLFGFILSMVLLLAFACNLLKNPIAMLVAFLVNWAVFFIQLFQLIPDLRDLEALANGSWNFLSINAASSAVSGLFPLLGSLFIFILSIPAKFFLTFTIRRSSVSTPGSFQSIYSLVCTVLNYVLGIIAMLVVIFFMDFLLSSMNSLLSTANSSDIPLPVFFRF